MAKAQGRHIKKAAQALQKKKAAIANKIASDASIGETVVNSKKLGRNITLAHPSASPYKNGTFKAVRDSAENIGADSGRRKVKLAGPGPQGNFKKGTYTRKKQILNSNEAINPKEKGGLFNAEPVIGFVKEGYQGIKDASSAYGRISKEMGDNAKMLDVGKRALKEVYTNNDGSLNAKKIAGSYMIAAGGARVVSGGGLYKDRNGRTDIVGVPLI